MLKSILVLARPTAGDMNFYKRWHEVGTVCDKPGNLQDIEAIVTDQYTPVDTNILLHYPNLKYVVSATTGETHLERTGLELAGVTVLTLKGHEDFLKTITSAAEHTVYLLMKLAKEIRPIPVKLAGKKAAIIGVGRVGKQVANAFRAMGIDVRGYDIGMRSDYLGSLMRESDIVSIHLSENEDTIGMISAEKIKNMKQGAFFINTSRASIVNCRAVYNRCHNHEIYAACDVWSDGTPRSAINLLLTPHVGGRSIEDRITTDEFMIKRLRSILTR